MLNTTLETVAFKVDKIEKAIASTNLTLQLETVDIKRANKSLKKSIQVELFISQTFYDFKLMSKAKGTSLPILKLGFNPLGRILNSTGRPLSFELVGDSVLNKSIRDTPRLIKKYTLARQLNQNWSFVRRHHNRMVIKVSMTQGLESRENADDGDKYSSNPKNRSSFVLQGSESYTEQLQNLPVNKYLVYNGDEKVWQVNQFNKNPTFTDIYYNIEDKTTTFTLLEVLPRSQASRSYSTRIHVKIFSEAMELLKDLSLNTFLDISPTLVYFFKPSQAAYSVIYTQDTFGFCSFLGVKGSSLYPMKNIGIAKLATPLPIVVLRLSQKLLFLRLVSGKTRNGYSFISLYTFEFFRGLDMQPKVTGALQVNPYINSLNAMVCRELEKSKNHDNGGEEDEFVGQCIFDYNMIGPFLLKIRKDSRRDLVYTKKLIEGQNNFAKLKDPSLLCRKRFSHYWDLNEDLIVKIKYGEDEDSESGIKVWELKDAKNYTLNKGWPSKYNDQVYRMGFSYRVVLVRSPETPLMVSMFFQRDSDLWENTVIRYDLDGKEGLEVPSLEYAEHNLDLLKLRFVYGDGNAIKKVSLNDLVQVEKIPKERGNFIVFSIVVTLLVILMFVLFLWGYYMYFKRKMRRIAREASKKHAEEKREKDGSLQYSSLNGSKSEELGNTTYHSESRWELTEMTEEPERRMSLSQKVTACLF